MAKKFTGSVYPALSFYADDKRFKFKGGELIVSDEDAEGVANFAAMKPQYKISGPFEYVAPPKPDEVPDPAAQKFSATPPETFEVVNDPEVPPEDSGEPRDGDPDQSPEVPGDPEADANDEADANAIPFDEDAERDRFNAMKNDELRKVLGDAGENVSGNHTELVDRAVDMVREQAAGAADAGYGPDGENGDVPPVD
jgi:hypothetical protein